MKKNILTILTILCGMIAFILSISCNQRSDKNEGEKWLESIFQCEDGNGYCLPEEKDIFTERYDEFYSESNEIFEFPFFETKDEEVAAQNAFKEKWKDIYPLDNYVLSPFGRGNGMEAGERLENVTIIHISDLEYNVLVEYRDGNVFSNDLLLIPSGDTFLIDYINTELEEQKTINADFTNSGIDQILPIFMINEAKTILYDEASINSQIIYTIKEYDNSALIGLTAMKDAENKIWYKCYYPGEQIEGWTYQVSHQDYNHDEKLLPLLQIITLAKLQLGANPREAVRLLGKPQTEHSEKGPLEVSGYIDEDCFVTTTSMEYDGIELIYEDDQMMHANITKPGKSFGWITVGDNECDKDFLIRKFKLTQDDFFNNEEGDAIAQIYCEVLLVTVSFGDNDMVKTISYYCGP